ncbi:MAG: hypothetical protein LBL46_00725 [Rickettsiales bacterium]|jgi:hypothetical protein|nr:hypothetical protein [Rickettsiales bacterium]
MNKMTYAADGVSAEFDFAHKWFRPADIRAFVNGAPIECSVRPAADAPEYETPEMSAANDLGIAAHFGGRVVLATPPAAGATITIIRRVSIDERLVAVSRTSAVRPGDFNLFADWMTEYLKDLAADFAGLDDAEILPELTAGVAAARELLGDASNLVTTAQLAEAVQSLTAAMENEPGRVVEQSAPGANPWFRKYKSGWVEQGGSTSGVASAAGKPIQFPIQMCDTNYNFQLTPSISAAPNAQALSIASLYSGKSASGITAITTANNASYSGFSFSWQVSGYCA